MHANSFVLFILCSLCLTLSILSLFLRKSFKKDASKEGRERDENRVTRAKEFARIVSEMTYTYRDEKV